jgi:tRNA G26 N,N-dimethylase Trm1
MESILTDILMKVSDVLTQKMALRVSDVLTHPGQRCPDTCQIKVSRETMKEKRHSEEEIRNLLGLVRRETGKEAS